MRLTETMQDALLYLVDVSCWALVLYRCCNYLSDQDWIRPDCLFKVCQPTYVLGFIQITGCVTDMIIRVSNNYARHQNATRIACMLVGYFELSVSRRIHLWDCKNVTCIMVSKKTPSPKNNIISNRERINNNIVN